MHATTAATTLLLLVSACAQPPPAELTDIATLPAWELTSDAGQSIGSKSLAGKVWVANFLFTSCPSSCPPLARATKELQDRLAAGSTASGGPPIQIVSVSVDPVTDTPDVLRAFGVQYGADPRVWHFATGDYDAMERLVTDGFLLPILRSDVPPRGLPGRAEAAGLQRPTPIDTAHSLQFVVVDGAGRIRGVFDKTPDGLAKVEKVARWLASHP
ncbi:MAG: SCO family protein [Myxococcales bacterium]|nr:SCO family protein [Myxococcales bacterium]